MGPEPFSGENSGEPGIGFLFEACVDRDDQRHPSEFRSIPSSGEISGDSRGLRSVSFRGFYV
jgi:hypothetical protein